MEVTHLPARLADLKLVYQSQEKKADTRTFFIEGEEVQPSEKFWKSLKSLYGIRKDYLYFYDLEELASRLPRYRRLTKKATPEDIRFTLLRRSEDTPWQLVNISPLTQTALTFTHLLDFVKEQGIADVYYHQGFLRWIQPGEPLRIGAEPFQWSRAWDIPIDGSDSGSIYPSFLRLACLNGLVVQHPFYQQKIAMHHASEEKIFETLALLVKEDGFLKGKQALIQRLQDFQHRHASVKEVMAVRTFLEAQGLATDRQRLEQALDFLEWNTVIKQKLPTLLAYGDIPKNQSALLPSPLSFHHLLQLVSEYAKFVANDSNPLFQAYLGSLIQAGPQLEGFAQQTEFKTIDTVFTAHAVDRATLHGETY